MVLDFGNFHQPGDDVNFQNLGYALITGNSNQERTIRQPDNTVISRYFAVNLSWFQYLAGQKIFIKKLTKMCKNKKYIK